MLITNVTPMTNITETLHKIAKMRGKTTFSNHNHKIFHKTLIFPSIYQ